MISRFPSTRCRRLRRTEVIRQLVTETRLVAENLIYPIFIHDSGSQCVPIQSMPGIVRVPIGDLLVTVEEALNLGIKSFALFPCLESENKTTDAREAYNPSGLIPRAIKEVKGKFPDVCLIADVALDPYTSHGQDGLVGGEGQILNDETVEILVKQALVLADAGSDMVAPSDMMDGRVGAIRTQLEKSGFQDTLILSYTAKYASALYGPFRDAVNSAHHLGKSDKKSYQMAPTNISEALREARLDIGEGADIVMVKPGGLYMDVIKMLKEQFDVPVFAYQVSGEYSMIKAAAKQGWLDERSVALESLIALRRAGCDAILTYFAVAAAGWLRDQSL